MAEKPPKNGKESLQRLVKHRNIVFLWLGGVLNTGRILSENGRPEIFSENGTVGISDRLSNLSDLSFHLNT